MTVQPSSPATSTGPQVSNAAEPGALRGGFTLTLHTRQAQRLFLGRAQKKNNPDKKLEVPGVGRFAMRLRQVKVGVQADDPYADWTLIQLDEALEKVESEYQAHLQDLARRMQSDDRINIQTAHSVKPIEETLGFDNAYGYAAVRLLATFDKLAVAILSANHTAIIDRDERERLLQFGQRRYRYILQLPQHYRFSGATREDFLGGTRRAQQAKANLGPVPESIITREQTPRFSIGTIQPPPNQAASGDDHVDPEELRAAAAELRGEVAAA